MLQQLLREVRSTRRTVKLLSALVLLLIGLIFFFNYPRSYPEGFNQGKSEHESKQDSSPESIRRPPELFPPHKIAYGVRTSAATYDSRFNGPLDAFLQGVWRALIITDKKPSNIAYPVFSLWDDVDHSEFPNDVLQLLKAVKVPTAEESKRRREETDMIKADGDDDLEEQKHAPLEEKLLEWDSKKPTIPLDKYDDFDFDPPADVASVKFVDEDKKVDTPDKDDLAVINAIKIERFKYLKGLEAMYNKYPSADWYVMIDDNSFVFPENLKYLLSVSNSQDRIYAGAGFLFDGCGSVVDGKRFPYANEDGAILLSKAALESLIKRNVAICLEIYNECGAGDVVLALCLRDAGVKLNHRLSGDLFRAGPPLIRLGFGYRPCDRVISYGQVPISTAKALSRLRQKEATTFADVFTSLHMPKTPVIEDNLFLREGDEVFNYMPVANQLTGASRDVLLMNGIDLPGADIAGVHVENWPTCQKMCTAQPLCVGWSFIRWEHRPPEGRCWMKHTLPAMRKRTKAVSGVLPSRMSCTLYE